MLSLLTVSIVTNKGTLTQEVMSTKMCFLFEWYFLKEEPIHGVRWQSCSYNFYNIMIMTPLIGESKMHRIKFYIFFNNIKLPILWINFLRIVVFTGYGCASFTYYGQHYFVNYAMVEDIWWSFRRQANDWYSIFMAVIWRWLIWRQLQEWCFILVGDIWWPCQFENSCKYGVPYCSWHLMVVSLKTAVRMLFYIGSWNLMVVNLKTTVRMVFCIGTLVAVIWR